MGKPRWASATCPETAPSWTSESTTEPEARTPSTPFFFSLFQTVLLPLNIFLGASLCMPFSLPEPFAGQPLVFFPGPCAHVLFLLCYLPAALSTVRVRATAYSCVGYALTVAPTERHMSGLSLSSSPLAKACCLRNGRFPFGLPPAGRCKGTLLSYLDKRT